MPICLESAVIGSHLTDNFDFNEVTKQIVPRPGTDTKPGALALNLGNNLPGDATNATDALTAAGFNAMATAVDGTDPFCGNEIQQAVTAAVGQSIACDADAQEAIACAIASNPDAIACLAAALPSSGGAECSGSAMLYATPVLGTGNYTAIKSTDGSLAVAATVQSGFGNIPTMLNAANRPFTIGLIADGSITSYGIDFATGAMTPIMSLPGADRSPIAINKDGTKLLVGLRNPTDSFNATLEEYTIDATGNLVSKVVKATGLRNFYLRQAYYLDDGSIILNQPGAAVRKLVAGVWVPFDGLPDQINANSLVVSPDGKFAVRGLQQSGGSAATGYPLVVELYSITGTTATFVNTSNTVMSMPRAELNSPSVTWAPDSTHALIRVDNSYPSGTGNQRIATLLYYADVTSGQAVLRTDRVLVSSSNRDTTLGGLITGGISMSATGKYLFAVNSKDGSSVGPKILIQFQRIGDRYIQCSTIDLGADQLSVTGTEL